MRFNNFEAIMANIEKQLHFEFNPTFIKPKSRSILGSIALSTSIIMIGFLSFIIKHQPITSDDSHKATTQDKTMIFSEHTTKAISATEQQLNYIFIPHFNEIHQDMPIAANDINILVSQEKDNVMCAIKHSKFSAIAYKETAEQSCAEAMYGLNGMLHTEETKYYKNKATQLHN
jgi:hypothetical protein